MSAAPAANDAALLSRHHGRDHLSHLNDRFAQYVARVHQVQEQTKSVENATLVAHTQQLEQEMDSLKGMYEKELGNVRGQLTEMTHDRNEKDLSAAKHIALSADLETKLSGETNNRKKLENALGDAHRLLSEKDANIQELQITVAEHQSSHLDTSTDRDAIQASLHNVTNAHDAEAAQRKELQAKNLKLQDELAFQEEKHAREVRDLTSRINAAECAIKIAEERLAEHDNIDDQLAQTLAKVKLQSHAELVRYQEEAEFSYQASLQSVKNQLDQESQNLGNAIEENIKLKACVEDTKAQLSKTASKCATAEEVNRNLIKEMEMERTLASQQIQKLEQVRRDLQEDINSKIRELNHAYNANIPVDIEIEAFSGLLDAEERRLNVTGHNPAPEIINNVAAYAHPLSRSGRPLSARSILPPIALRRGFPAAHMQFAAPAVEAPVAQ